MHAATRELTMAREVELRPYRSARDDEKASQNSGTCTCGAHAMHMRCARDAHAMHTRCTCGAHAVHTRCTCSAHAMHMRCTCGAHAVHMRCTCTCESQEWHHECRAEARAEQHWQRGPHDDRGARGHRQCRCQDQHGLAPYGVGDLAEGVTQHDLDEGRDGAERAERRRRVG